MGLTVDFVGEATPLVSGETLVRFTAGLTTYEVLLRHDEPAFRASPLDDHSIAVLPTSAQDARRLGWTVTKFNRKLDNVCDKLSRLGVRGLQGDAGRLASNRRARLVEYALAVRLVTRDDLAVLDEATVVEN